MTNPLGKIKDVAAGSIKAPVTVARTALGVATGAAGKAAGAATSLVGGRHETADPTPEFPAAPAAPAPPEAKAPEEEAPQVTISPDEPVNVTKELGLDPAPVAKPKRARKPATKPMTGIDAAADPSSVDVTPAEVAQAVGKDGTTAAK